MLAAAGTTRTPPMGSDADELAPPVLQQYNATLVRKLEDKSTELERAYDGLSQTEARLSGLVETAMDAIIACDEQQRITLFNSAAEQMFGCPRKEAIDGPLGAFIPQRFREGHTRQLEQFGQTGYTKRMGAKAVWGLRRDGTEFPIEASISKLETSRGRLYTVFIRDITERQLADASIRRMNRVLTVLSGINTLIVRATDREELFREACRIAIDEGHFLQAWIGMVDDDRRAVRFVTGRGKRESSFHVGLHAYLERHRLGDGGILATAIDTLRPVLLNDSANDPKAIRAAVEAGSRAAVILPLVCEGVGVGVFVLHSETAGFFNEEELKLLRELAGDISFALEDIRKSEQLHYHAQYDLLTGLPNRRLFSERLSQAILAKNGDDSMLAAVLIDLERFRNVNETLGRASGDELIRQAASRLQHANETSARIGVDTFAFKIRDARSAAEIARAVDDLLARCFSEPFIVQGHELRIGVRGGVAVFPSDGADPEALLRNAEAALRRGKTTQERCVFYAPIMNARAAEALTMESKLRRAIERQEFVLHYQPKISMADRRITSLEALIRWQHPERGLVPPMQFIPVLEECGLIGTVGEWAILQSLADQRRWRTDGLLAPRIAVNVSPLQLRRKDFAEAICAIVASNHGVELELEITESVMMEEVDRNIGVLRTVREAGVSIAIDDFGTGFSSLAYIARLPVTCLKIDRAFINGMMEGPEGLAIVSSILGLAHSLDLKVVAEGVETEEQARLLHLLRCDEAQGYLFSKPLPVDPLEKLLRSDGPLSCG
ncbi:MAG TPA: EAL domain-containing protein [Xanthomonadaceae bacterium]